MSYRTLDTYDADLLNDSPPRRETVTEIQEEKSGDLLCYANPDRALDICRAVNLHPDLVEALSYPRFGTTADLLEKAADFIDKLQEDVPGESIFTPHLRRSAKEIREALEKSRQHQH